MALSKEYLAWYRETRCEYGEGKDRCNQAKEIMIEKDGVENGHIPFQRVEFKDGSVDYQYPTFKSRYCYYHNKKMEGKFDITPEICKKEGGQS